MEVAYLCDGKACEDCNKGGSYCTHTTDIKHAINFNELDADHFIEIPEPTSMNFAMSPKEFKTRMNNLAESHQKRLGLEVTHTFMEDLMCKVLRELGYSEGVDIFMEQIMEMNVKKQYARRSNAFYKLKESSDIKEINIAHTDPLMNHFNMPYKTFEEILGNNFYPTCMPKKIIFNRPATIVIWDDGTKTVVKQSKYDNYDYEKGFAMCVVEKVFGDKRNAIRKMVDEAYSRALD